MHFLNDENDKALKKKFIKLDQTSSNRFPPDSLSLSLIFLPTKLLVRDACEGVTKEEKEEEEEDK